MKREQSKVWEIARWEFLRFFKWRDQIISLVILILGMGFGALVQTMSRNSTDEVKLAVIADGPIPLPERFKTSAHTLSELPDLTLKVQSRDLDGVLVLTEGRDQIVARRQLGWINEVEQIVSQSRQNQRLQQLNVNPVALAQALQPVKLNLVRPEGQSGADGALIFGMVVSGLIAMALLTGLSYLWIGLTGEKQNRVTEQLFSFVPAQAMVDGKLLGIALITLNGVAQLAIISIGVGWLTTGGLGFLADLFRTVTVLEGTLVWVFALLGFAFWFAVAAIVFATINDPASSQRNSILFLPLAPAAAAIVGIPNIDSAAMQFLSVFPLTGMSVMPIRLLVGEPASWEIALSLLLLVTCVWWARKAAAKVYAVGMLMYGKEPTWKEIWRWAR